MKVVEPKSLTLILNSKSPTEEHGDSKEISFANEAQQVLRLAVGI